MKIVKQVLIFVPLTACIILALHYLTSIRDEGFGREKAVLAACSALISLPVLAFHWAVPPHPKFLLRPKRKWCIRIHVIAGMLEYTIGVIAICSGAEEAGRWMAIVALGLHIPTAAFQTSTIFGSRVLMIPSYVFCLCVHGYCALHLLLSPESHFWLIQTFLAFSVYAWVRLFYYAFQRWKLFTGWSYTTAVLMAGVFVGPAILGPLAPAWLLLAVLLFVFLFWLIEAPTREQLLDNLLEHRRGIFHAQRLQRVWQRLKRRAEALAACSADEMSVEQAMFEILGGANDSQLSAVEIGQCMLQEGADPTLVGHVIEYLQQAEIDFETFRQKIWNLFEVRLNGGMRERLQARGTVGTRTPKEQAELVFDQLDIDGSGEINTFELRLLLLEWDLPSTDVHDFIQRHGASRQGIRFDSFYQSMKPVWQFAFHDRIV